VLSTAAMIRVVRLRHVLLFVVAALALAIPCAALAEDAPSNPAADACKAEYLQLGADAFKAKYGASEPYQVCLAAHGGATTTTTPTAPQNTVEAACKAEYVQLGATAFLAKYGSEPLQACIRAHGGTVTAPPATKPSDDTAAGRANALAVQLCELEYKRLGADAFTAKYGAGDGAKRACVAAQLPQAKAILAKCASSVGQDQLEACVKQALGVQSGGGDAPKKGDAPAPSPSMSLAQALCKNEAKSLGTDAFRKKYGKEALGACVKATLPEAQATVAACKQSAGDSRDAFKQCLSNALQRRR
jgi:hypothetical protein